MPAPQSLPAIPPTSTTAWRPNGSAAASRRRARSSPASASAPRRLAGAAKRLRRACAAQALPDERDRGLRVRPPGRVHRERTRSAVRLDQVPDELPVQEEPAVLVRPGQKGPMRDADGGKTEDGAEVQGEAGAARMV